jgi:Fur family peroxide stress response transcriptional regulator
MAESLANRFQDLCREKQLAATHQRLVIYRELMQMHNHPNPEQVFERVKAELPSISLATVYKTLHTFIEAGIVREVSPHHGSLRIEPNVVWHPHFLCLQCMSITDLTERELDYSALKDSIPAGYRVEQISTEVRGICGHCMAKSDSAAQA